MTQGEQRGNLANKQRPNIFAFTGFSRFPYLSLIGDLVSQRCLMAGSQKVLLVLEADWGWKYELIIWYLAVSFLWWDRCLARCLAVWNVVGEAEGVHTRHPDTGTEGPPEWGTVAVWSRCGRSSGSSRRYGRSSSSISISSSRGGVSRCTVADAGRAHSVTHCRTWLPGSNGGQRQRELEISKKPACLFNSLLSQLPFQFQPLMIHAWQQFTTDVWKSSSSHHL